MKTLPTLFAASLALVLVLAPMTTFAATGAITFSSPPSGSSFKGTQSYTISGTVSPAPGTADEVFIQVKNPAGTLVDATSATVNPTTGAFNYATATGGTAEWVSGTYSISAMDSNGALGSETFSYTAPAGGFNQTALLLQMNATLTQLESQMKTLTAAVTAIQGTLTQIQGSLSTISTQVGNINNVITPLGTQVSTAAQNAQNAANAVSSTQTYVLVVAVLAAITLVLELAILVRKLS
jgi:hypothetical protein